MEIMKAEKYDCSFKGISTREQQESNDNEFNHSKEVITAFSCEDAFSKWLKEMWDVSLSVSIPYPLTDDVVDYGSTYEDFIASKDVEFTLFNVKKDHIRVEIKYKGRNDFYYEVLILKQ